MAPRCSGFTISHIGGVTDHACSHRPTRLKPPTGMLTRLAKRTDADFQASREQRD
jgi:hypothetical protein